MMFCSFLHRLDVALHLHDLKGDKLCLTQTYDAKWLQMLFTLTATTHVGVSEREVVIRHTEAMEGEKTLIYS